MESKQTLVKLVGIGAALTLGNKFCFLASLTKPSLYLYRFLISPNCNFYQLNFGYSWGVCIV